MSEPRLEAPSVGGAHALPAPNPTVLLEAPKPVLPLVAGAPKPKPVLAPNAVLPLDAGMADCKPLPLTPGLPPAVAVPNPALKSGLDNQDDDATEGSEEPWPNKLGAGVQDLEPLPPNSDGMARPPISLAPLVVAGTKLLLLPAPPAGNDGGAM